MGKRSLLCAGNGEVRGAFGRVPETRKNNAIPVDIQAWKAVYDNEFRRSAAMLNRPLRGPPGHATATKSSSSMRPAPSRREIKRVLAPS